MMSKSDGLAAQLRAQVKLKGHIVLAAVGSGLFTKYAIIGGADVVAVLPSGFFRQMGRTSNCCYLPFADLNRMSMEKGCQEILPIVGNTPVLFGLWASDPYIQMDGYLDQIVQSGFAGVINYPSVSFLDGVYAEALREEGVTYENEVRALALAHQKGLLTVAFVHTVEQARRMLAIGADMICVNFGLTKGGIMGAKKAISLEACAQHAQKIFNAFDDEAVNVIKLVFGGPIKLPFDVKYMYDNTSTMGFMGGSTFDRIPFEQIAIDTTRQFSYTGKAEQDKLVAEILDGIENYYNYVDFVKKYVDLNYHKKISFGDLANAIHVSRSYLSTMFKNEVGCTFPEYLTKYRLGKATEMLRKSEAPLNCVAELVGYDDYAHFSKSFKKLTGLSPREWRDQQRAAEQEMEPKTKPTNERGFQP